MQRFSEQELEEMAKPYLTQQITEVFATTDGQVFYDANRASQHATQRSLTMYAFGGAATGNPLQLPEGESANGNELSATGEEATAETEAIGQEPTAETLPAKQESPMPEARKPEAHQPEATLKSKKQ